MSKNQKLNRLVIQYQQTNSDGLFNEIYKIVSEDWISLSTVATSLRSNTHETLAAYEDTLLRCIKVYNGKDEFIHLLKRSIWRARRDIYRNQKTRISRECLEVEMTHEDVAIFEYRDDFDLEEHITGTKKADQRQLIDSLLNGEDETTTAIVEAFLNHPKPTATAIAKELGFNHHSKVIRALTRLAAKYDSKQHGSHRDYLVAL